MLEHKETMNLTESFEIEENKDPLKALTQEQFDQHVDNLLECINGNGLFQKLTFFSVAWGLSSFGFWFYNLAFLCMPPKFLCNYVGRQESFVCRQQEFCGNPDLEWMIDYSNPQTLHNWIEKLSLVCKPSWQIGLLGSAYFAGMALTLLWLPSYADR